MGVWGIDKQLAERLVRSKISPIVEISILTKQNSRLPTQAFKHPHPYTYMLIQIPFAWVPDFSVRNV